ncbi:MAG: tetratricopeptide repeat protein [Cyclobacteriaceae bacterium]|nr:tetratricopeptide repeat protein [Cyclobacteriaceae bacterium HetDA_MAG_MS6]
MAKTKQKPANEGLDVMENPDVLVSKAEEFFNNKRNQNIVFGIGGVIALIIAALAFYRYQVTSNNAEAQLEMFQAVYYFEADSLGKALNGDGNNYGFLDIIDLYGGTEAANLASFYAGSTYLLLSDYDNAVRYLTDFSSNDYLVQARAYSLIGDAYMEQDDFSNAASFYGKAVDYKPNKEFTPIYLKKLAIAFEEQGDLEKAAAAYQRIIDDFFSSNLTQEAYKQKSRLEGLSVE